MKEAEEAAAVKLSVRNRAIEASRRARIVCAEAGIEKELAALSDKELQRLASSLNTYGSSGGNGVSGVAPTATSLFAWAVSGPSFDRVYEMKIALFDMGEQCKRPEALKRQDRAKRLRLEAKRRQDQDDERHMQLIIERLQEQHHASQIACERLEVAYSKAKLEKEETEAVLQKLISQRNAQVSSGSGFSIFRRFRDIV